MNQQPNDSLGPEQIQQLIAAGWWTSGDDRWFGPEQHPDPAHRAHFASTQGQQGLETQPAPQPLAPAAFAPPAQVSATPPTATAPEFPPLQSTVVSPPFDPVVQAAAPFEPQLHDAAVAPSATPPQTMAYAESADAMFGEQAVATQPPPPTGPPQLSPLAQQMAEEARRKALPPTPEATESPKGVPDEEWRRIVAADAAAMEANTPGQVKRRGSGKRRQRRNLLPISAMFFAIAGLIAFAYYVPSVRSTLIETKAQITGEQVPVTVRPAPDSLPNESGMAVLEQAPISG